MLPNHMTLDTLYLCGAAITAAAAFVGQIVLIHDEHITNKFGASCVVGVFWPFIVLIGVPWIVVNWLTKDRG